MGRSGDRRERASKVVQLAVTAIAAVHSLATGGHADTSAKKAMDGVGELRADAQNQSQDAASKAKQGRRQQLHRKADRRRAKARRTPDNRVRSGRRRQPSKKGKSRGVGRAQPRTPKTPRRNPPETSPSKQRNVLDRRNAPARLAKTSKGQDRRRLTHRNDPSRRASAEQRRAATPQTKSQRQPPGRSSGRHQDARGQQRSPERSYRVERGAGKVPGRTSEQGKGNQGTRQPPDRSYRQPKPTKSKGRPK